MRGASLHWQIAAADVMQPLVSLTTLLLGGKEVGRRRSLRTPKRCCRLVFLGVLIRLDIDWPALSSDCHDIIVTRRKKERTRRKKERTKCMLLERGIESSLT